MIRISFSKKLKLISAVFALCVLSPLGLQAVAEEQQDNIWPMIRHSVELDPAVEARVSALMATMSVEQKVGQTVMAEIHSISPQEVKKFHIGGLLNGGGSYPTKKKDGPFLSWLAAANAYYDASVDASDDYLPIPIIWGTDAVHGHNNVTGATLFPHNIGLGAANNPDLMRLIGEITAREVRATGIPWVFAPTVTVPQDIRWGRTYEGYSSDPKLVAKLGQEMVIGLQGHPALENFLGEGKVVATAKHFIGDGGTTDGDDQGDTELSEAALSRIHGRGYFTSLAVGVQTVMASFNSWNGAKLHGSKYMLTDVLKGRLGFDGFVVGDWNGHEQLPGCTVVRCAQAFNAGVDMIMVPIDWRGFYQNLVKQVKSGDVTMERLDDAVRRILRVKFRAGLFDKGRPSEQKFAGVEQVLGHPSHRAIARQAVRESLVLLKNEGVLPLNPKQSILVAGDGADDISKQSGGWSLTWQGRDNQNEDFKGATSLLAGLKEQIEEAGGDVHFKNMPKGQKPDAAIVVFGEDPYAEFEGDLTTSVAFKDDKALGLMKELKAEGVSVVAVLLSGRPLAVPGFLENADAFVAAWLPGSEGAGVADLLLQNARGEAQYDFKGKLPFNWPASGDAEQLGNHAFTIGFGLNYAE